MTTQLNRRDFAKGAVGMVGAAVSLDAASPVRRNVKIGHTGITWGNNIEQAIQDIASLGYYGFETFGDVIESWETKGGLGHVLQANDLPLISAYCNANLVD